MSRRALEPMLLLGHLMRWSPVRYLIPVFLGLEIASVLNQGMRWRGEWAWTVDWSGGGILLVGPLVAGVAVWRVSAARRALGECADVVANPRRATVAELVGVIGWAWATHVLAVTVMLVLTATAGAGGVPDLLPLLPQFVVMAGYAGMGALLGALVPNPLMAPLTTLVLLVATTQFSAGTLPALWVTVGGATGSLVGLRYTPAVLAVQVVLGAALVALSLTVRRSAVGPLEARASVTAIPLVLVLASSGWLAGTDKTRIEVDPTPVALRCAGEAPVVCVRPESSAALRDLVRTFHALDGAARSLGASDTPARFEQVPAAQVDSGRDRAFVLQPGAVVAGKVDVAMVTHYYVLNRSCLSGDDAPPSDAVLQLETIGAVLAVRAGLADPTTLPSPDLQRLATGTAQNGAVAEALRAAQDCRFADVPRAL